MKGLLKELEHHIFQEINFKDLLYQDHEFWDEEE